VVNGLALGLASRPCHYSTILPRASCLLTLPFQSSPLQETGAQKEVLVWTDLTA